MGDLCLKASGYVAIINSIQLASTGMKTFYRNASSRAENMHWACRARRHSPSTFWRYDYFQTESDIVLARLPMANRLHFRVHSGCSSFLYAGIPCRRNHHACQTNEQKCQISSSYELPFPLGSYKRSFSKGCSPARKNKSSSSCGLRAVS